MINKKIFLSFLSFSSFVPLVVTSCNTNNNLLNILYKNEFEFSYEYIHTFSNSEYDFDKNINKTFWEKNEILNANESFLIKFDSQSEDGKIYLDLFNYEVRRWYFLLIEYDSKSINFEKLDKQETNNLIFEKITNNWKNDVSVLLDITNNLALNENENRSKVNNDASTSFLSSWGVWNHSSKKSSSTFLINERMLRETSSIEANDESYVFEEIKLTNFYYLPLIEVIDPPIGEAFWNQDVFLINDKKINNSLDNKKQKVLLPKNADSGQEWWKWFTNGRDGVDYVTSFISGVIGSLVGAVLCETGAGAAVAGTAVGLAVDAALHELFNSIIKNYNNNKYEIDNYNETILKKGYCISFDEPIDLDISNNIIKIDSTVRYGAKATAWSGDRSKARIYSTPAIAQTLSKVRKYAII